MKLWWPAEKIHFFRYQSQEVAAIFNLPLLFKCTHNLVLKHGVANVECDIIVNGKQLTGTAKWEDILKLTNILCIA